MAEDSAVGTAVTDSAFTSPDVAANSDFLLGHSATGGESIAGFEALEASDGINANAAAASTKRPTNIQNVRISDLPATSSVPAHDHRRGQPTGRRCLATLV